MKTIKLAKFKVIDHSMRESPPAVIICGKGEYNYTLTVRGHTKEKALKHLMSVISTPHGWFQAEVDLSGVEESIRQLITIDTTPVCAEEIIDPWEDTLMLSRPPCGNLEVDLYFQDRVYVNQLDICQNCKKRFWISILYSLEKKEKKA